MPGSTPSQPGWYPDGAGNQRWFDGKNWTDHVQPGQSGQGPVDDSTVVVPLSSPGTAELPQATGQYGEVPPPAWNQPGQAGYGQPGYGPPGFGQPQQGSGGKGLWIALAVVGVLLLIGLAVVAAFLLLGDDEDEGTGTDEPSSTSTSETSVQTEETEETEQTEETEEATEPTDVPTVPDTALPTDLPPGFPTDLPTDFPTDPAEWESWFSEYLEQELP